MIHDAASLLIGYYLPYKAKWRKSVKTFKVVHVIEKASMGTEFWYRLHNTYLQSWWLKQCAKFEVKCTKDFLKIVGYNHQQCFHLITSTHDLQFPWNINCWKPYISIYSVSPHFLSWIYYYPTLDIIYVNYGCDINIPNFFVLLSIPTFPYI